MKTKPRASTGNNIAASCTFWSACQQVSMGVKRFLSTLYTTGANYLPSAVVCWFNLCERGYTFTTNDLKNTYKFLFFPSCKHSYMQQSIE